MKSNRPMFKVRFLDDGSGYVIDAVWPNGNTEQLLGLYTAPLYAQQWVIEHSEAWLKDRL